MAESTTEPVHRFALHTRRRVAAQLAGTYGAVATILTGAALANWGPGGLFASPWGALLTVGTGLMLARWGQRLPSGAPPQVLVTPTELAFEAGDKATPFCQWDEPLGISFLAPRSGETLVMAFTTRTKTRCVAAELGPGASPRARALRDRAAPLPDDGAILGFFGGAARLSSDDAVGLLDAVTQRSQTPLGRICTSSPKGEDVRLEDASLRIGETLIDLSAPIEWRSYYFQESGGSVQALYQALAVRQNDTELTLVSLAPGTLGFVDEPPPVESRLAVDRIMMPVFRRAFEGAPRAKATAFHARAGSEPRA